MFFMLFTRVKDIYTLSSKSYTVQGHRSIELLFPLVEGSGASCTGHNAVTGSPRDTLTFTPVDLIACLLTVGGDCRTKTSFSKRDQT